MRLILILSVVTILFACKKGENDPFLSLRSRDARITGKWELKEANWQEQDNDEVSNYTYAENVSNGTITYSETGSPSESFSYTMTLEIKKEGTYEMISIEDGVTSRTEGDWWWLSDTKKKTRLSLDDDWDSYEVDRLTNKELVLKVKKVRYFSGSGWYNEMKYDVTLTFEKKK